MSSGLAAAVDFPALVKQDKPLTWVFTGDSITHGAAHTQGWRSYPEHCAERIRWEMRRVRDTVINTGISGDRLHRMMPNVEARVLRFKPDIVSVNFGMNDCTAGVDGRDVFRNALGDCLKAVEGAGAKMVLHAPNWIHYPADAARKDLGAYVEIIRAFATEHQLTLVDHYAEWMNTRKPTHKLLELLNDGAIHPNQYGHILMAHTTLKAMNLFDPASAVGRMFIP